MAGVRLSDKTGTTPGFPGSGGVRAEPDAVRYLLITLALLALGFLLFLPLLAVFAQALQKGLVVYGQALSDPDTRSSVRLTLLTTAIVVPLNSTFGLLISWSVAKFNFWGKNLIITLIDLPFTVSPVIGGMIFVLLFGLNGWFGPWLAKYNLSVLFALPGIILATLFVTLPFVARELIPLMQSQGQEEEETAILLGAGGWQTFWRVTFPNIKWGLLYGVILCNARAVGEFGAVSVVSGHIRGLTNTVTLHIEVLYNEYNFAAAFAVSSLLTGVALVTLVAKTLVEWKLQRQAKKDRSPKPETLS